MRGLLVLLLCFLLCGFTLARVSDGDTIVVKSDKDLLKVRLYGIDCPEIEQPQGEQAKGLVAALMAPGSGVQLEAVDVDRFGRTVAIVTLPDGSILQERLLSEGFAWVFDRYCKRPECAGWRELESAARMGGVGIWAGEPIPPWEWRKRHTRRR